MPAYNRVTKQFQDGLGLDASDLNAFGVDLKAWILRQPGGSVAARPSLPGVTALTADRSNSLADTTSITADASLIGSGSSAASSGPLPRADGSSAFSDTTTMTADAA